MSLINFVLPNKTSSNRSCERIPELIKEKRMKYATENKEYEKILQSDNLRSCVHVPNSFADGFLCIPCNSLLNAVKSFHVPEVQRLLTKEKADPMCKDCHGMPVLYLLFCQSSLYDVEDARKAEVALLLLQNGAKID